MSATARRGMSVALVGLGITIVSAAPHAAARPGASTPKISLEHVGSDSTAFNVLATIVIGPSEVLLWDAQYHVADARRLADRIAATGKRLKAVVLSHPDHDHYMGAAAIVERFPGTPVYMTEKALAEYKQTATSQFRGEKARSPQLLPDSIVTPQPLPSTRLTIDGETVEVIADVTGDVQSGTNSMLWIPSLRTVLASDVIFDGIHAWLGASDETSRRRWRDAITRIRDLEPRYVVAGHKKELDSPNSPAVLDAIGHGSLTVRARARMNEM